MSSLWARVEPLLARVQKPARYIGCEDGAIVPRHDKLPNGGTVAWLLAYPDTYEIGLPNQGLQILYEILNERDDAVAERTYAPWLDLDRELRAARTPVMSQAAFRGRKIAGRFTLVILILLAVITGSLAGLTLVYSVDLPQIQELESYRPSTVTVLYDRNGEEIGSFALEQRQIVDYDDFAPVLRQAVVSIEDKSFWSHWGVNVFRVAGAALHDIRGSGRAHRARGHRPPHRPRRRRSGNPEPPHSPDE